MYATFNSHHAHSPRPVNAPSQAPQSQGALLALMSCGDKGLPYTSDSTDSMPSVPPKMAALRKCYGTGSRKAATHIKQARKTKYEDPLDVMSKQLTQPYKDSDLWRGSERVPKVRITPAARRGRPPLQKFLVAHQDQLGLTLNDDVQSQLYSSSVTITAQQVSGFQQAGVAVVKNVSSKGGPIPNLPAYWVVRTLANSAKINAIMTHRGQASE